MNDMLQEKYWQELIKVLERIAKALERVKEWNAQNAKGEFGSSREYGIVGRMWTTEVVKGFGGEIERTIQYNSRSKCIIT